MREGALLAIAEGECRYLASQRFAAERRISVFGDIEASLVSSFALEHILEQIARGTRELGISGCWLSLFESKGLSPEWSKLFLASDSKGTRILAPYGLRFRTAELVPGGLPGSWSAYVCEPLRFGDDRLGYLRLHRRLDREADVRSSARPGIAARSRGPSSWPRSATASAAWSAQSGRGPSSSRWPTRDWSRRWPGARVSSASFSRSLTASSVRSARTYTTISARTSPASGLWPPFSRAASPRRLGRGSRSGRGALPAAGETAARAKGIARGLYPAELEAKGIVGAVERLVQSAREREGASIRIEVTEGFAVRDSEKALHLYRIVQEALNNSLRHSFAKEILVGLYMDRETVTAEVSDDGVGIPPGEREDNGMGLHILKYRASVIGGELRDRSRDRGTTVTCRVAR